MIYGYRLEDVYQKRFQEGGLTIDQITVLFNHFKEREMEQFKNNAMIMGAKLKEDLTYPSSDEEKIQPGDTPALFGDPETYAHLTEQERREMTQRMIKGHKVKVSMRG